MKPASNKPLSPERIETRMEMNQVMMGDAKASVRKNYFVNRRNHVGRDWNG
jgi:hypothetical protein